jgi:hypothetical protein
MDITKGIYRTHLKKISNGKINQLDLKNFEVTKYFYETLKAMTKDNDVEFESVILKEMTDNHDTKYDPLYRATLKWRNDTFEDEPEKALVF